ncbi:hypothetical protein HDU85_003992 [Gaertneriomyces sp. JEL0708]|nr:hypothetical protein HDU85_003992 [Gaertneriomyces sp. JEL0708]
MRDGTKEEAEGPGCGDETALRRRDPLVDMSTGMSTLGFRWAHPKSERCIFNRTRDLLRTRLYEIDEQVRTFNVSRPQPTEYELPMPPNYMMNQAPLQSPTYYSSDPYEAYIPHQSSVPSPIIPLPSDAYMSPQPTALNHLQTPYQQPQHAQTSPISLTVPYTYAVVPSMQAHPPSSNMLGHSVHVPLENLQRIPLPNTYSSLPPDESLFSEGVITYLMQNFFLDTYPSWYPCPIHQESFMSKYPNQPPLLIYAMCAATARRSDHPVTRTYIASRGLPWYLAGEPYFWKARQIIAETHIDNSYESVLSLVTLGVAIAGAFVCEFRCKSV